MKYFSENINNIEKKYERRKAKYQRKSNEINVIENASAASENNMKENISKINVNENMRSSKQWRKQLSM